MDRRHALFLFAALPLGGCLGPSATGSLRNPAIRADFAAGESYTLATGDKLRVIVFGQDSLSNIYAVDAAGRISMPLIGPVRVGGMSTPEAGATIEARLRAGFLREPKVTVEVDSYRPFFILGEVTTSGQFAYVNGMTVQTAVAIAGGFSPRAERKTATVTRRTPRGPVTAEVPIDYPVRPGDTINVKERWF